MDYKCKPQKVEIYLNNQRKDIDTIYNENKNKYENCKLIIFNGGLYNWDWTPCCHLKIDNIAYTNNSDLYWGYGWNDVPSSLVLSNNILQYKNYIACNCLIKDGKKEALYYDRKKLGHKTSHTAWGILADGKHLISCETKIGRTLEELQEYMLQQGCIFAIAFDGGGSTQSIYANDSRVYSTDNPDRIVHNLILMWIPIEPQIKIIYRVQCGAFKYKDGAINFKNKIRNIPDTINAGYSNAYIRKIDNLYKVQIGAFSIKSNAEKVLNDLKSKGFNAFITMI